MSMIEANFSNVYDKNVEEHIFESFEAVPLPYQLYFNLETADKPTKKYAVYAGLGTMDQKAEGDVYPSDDALQQYSYELTMVSYGKSFAVTKEMEEDDMVGVVADTAADLGRAAAERLAINHASILNTGFTTTYGDEKALLALDHPLVSGTEQNELTVSSDLSVSSLTECMYTMMRTVDHRGRVSPLRPVRMIVPPELEKTASQIIGSDLEYGTTDNQVNWFKNKMELVTDPWLTDDDAFFLQAMNHGLVSVVRRPFVTGSYVDGPTGNMVYTADMRFAAGAKIWRGIFGSPGA